MAGKDDRFLRCTVGNEFTTGRETHALSKLNTGSWFDGQRSTLQNGQVFVDIVHVVSCQRHVFINHAADLLTVDSYHGKLAFLWRVNAVTDEHDLHLDVTTVSSSSRNLHLDRVQRCPPTISIQIHAKIYLIVFVVNDFHCFGVLVVTHRQPHLHIAGLTEGGAYQWIDTDGFSGIHFAVGRIFFFVIV